MKNFMAIHDTYDDAAAQAYKAYFREMYPDKMTHGEWAKSTVGEFATAVQVWQGSRSDFYCTHFTAESEDHVYKQLEAWGMPRFFSSMVIETERFTSALLPEDQEIDSSYFED
jgi:hypothetical protein